MTYEEAKEYLEKKNRCSMDYESCKKYEDCKGCPNDVDLDLLPEVMELAIKALEEQKKHRLIPVTERLPEEEGEYLCQKESGSFDICRFTKNAYKTDKYDFKQYKRKNKKLFYEYDSEWGFFYRVDIVAWMPLPEPYEEVE